MKEVTTQTVFKCDYCNRVSLSKSGMMMHEKWCQNNPHTHTMCRSCVHCHRETESYTVTVADYYDNDRDYIARETTFTCDIDGAKMYAPKVAIGNREKKQEIIDSADRQMKTLAEGCEHYEEIKPKY